MDKINIIKLFLYENKKKCLIGLLLISLLTISIIIYKTFNNEKSDVSEKLLFENTVSDKLEAKKEEVEEVEYYFIDIKGEVNTPGVYSIESGKRVVDAINMAGGLTSNANTSLLNLSMLLKDQMVIIVYSSSEVKMLSDTLKKQEIKNTICNDKVVNDACIVNSKETTLIPDIKSKESSSNNSSNIKTTDLGSEKININTSSKEVLMTLSKIGESKALAIIEYREKNGSFKTIEDIKNVSGIGDSLFEAIKDYITV